MMVVDDRNRNKTKQNKNQPLDYRMNDLRPIRVKIFFFFFFFFFFYSSSSFISEMNEGRMNDEEREREREKS